MWKGVVRKLRWEWERHLVRKLRAELAAGSFDAAFEIAEALLDSGPSAEGYEVLTCPIDRSQTGLREAELREMLARLEAAGTGNHPIWHHHLRGALLQRIPGAVAPAQFEMPARYRWMRFMHGHLVREQRHAYREAMDDFRETLHAAPGFWKAAACLAECALCLGQQDEAFRTFDDCVARVRSEGSPDELSQVITWRGELRLWVGEYRAALRDFEQAGTDRLRARLDPKASTLLALGWRGAARLLLGEAKGAMADLDRVVRRSPSDAEALTWRGEAHARAGRLDAASMDFDRAATMTPAPVWPLVGRALVRARLGDAERLWSDYDRLPARIRTFFERTRRISWGATCRRRFRCSSR